MKQFKGRVVAGGSFKGEAVVSRQGVNTLATFQSSVLKKSKKVIVSDQNNPDIYKLDITGKILCLPETIGSTTGGMVLQTVCSLNLNPAVFLFSEHIDPLAASGIVLSRVWENSKVIAIDQLGADFLKAVKTGDQIEVEEDGTVKVL